MVSDGKFLIPSGNTAAFLQMSEQTFNPIAFFYATVSKGREAPFSFDLYAITGVTPRFRKPSRIALRGTTFISRHLFRTTTKTTLRRANRHLIHCRKHQRMITCLSSVHQRRQRMKMIVAHTNNLCGPTAFRPANAVIGRLPCYFFSSTLLPQIYGL